MAMVTGFDYLSHDKVLQAHWLRRFAAVIIDFVIVYTPIWLVWTAMGFDPIFPGFFSGIFLFLYALVMESAIGGTIGKMIMHMKVVAVSGRMIPSQALTRNLSKVFPVLLLLDWIVGMAVDTHDPRQKWTDQIAHTSVIVYDHPSGT